MLATTRTFLLLALVGVLAALLAGAVSGMMAGRSDSGSLLLGVIVAGAALTAFSLVPPALRLLLRGWARVGIGPREPRAARRLADMLSVSVWLLWLVGGFIALPGAWSPLLARIGVG